MMVRSLASRSAMCVLALAFSRPVEAGDAFLKGALTVHPRQADLSDRWFISLGSDFPVNLDETALVGFELQTAWYREPAGAETLTVVPAHGFVNAKYKAPTVGTRPYAGAGIGLASFFTFLGGDTGWERDPAFHFLGGVELGGVSLELQVTRLLKSEASFAYSLLFGFVW